MFTELQLSGELRLRLAGAVVNGACIDQAGMSLALRLTTRAELGDAELEELKHLLMGVYGFRQVTTEVTCKAPSSQAAAAGSRPAASVPAAPSGSKGEEQAAGQGPAAATASRSPRSPARTSSTCSRPRSASSRKWPTKYVRPSR